MELPILNPIQSYREMVNVMGGYNHHTDIQDNEFYFTENTTSDFFPALSPRKPRKNFWSSQNAMALGRVSSISGGLVNGVTDLVIKDGTKLIIHGQKYDIGLEPNIRSTIVSMGRRVIVFPEGKIIDLTKATPGNPGAKTIDSVFSYTGNVTLELCTLKGSPITVKYTQASAPESPADLDYWIDTSQEKHILKRYSKATGIWASILTTYIKIKAPNLGEDFFRKDDGIKLEFPKPIEDIQVKDLEGYNSIWEIGAGYIVVVGIIDKIKTMASITISRTMPKMNIFFECNNRIWGCRYGTGEGDDSGHVNRVYASALGDPTNWHRFRGTADDSYYVDFGSEGPWTGGIAYKGRPCFFKEEALHIIYGENPPFSVQTTQMLGVQSGSQRSLAISNGTLFYKSRHGVCAYNGSMPVIVSDQFGDIQYEFAVADAYNNKYYISMIKRDEESNYFASDMFVLDISKGIWHREDDFHTSAIQATSSGIYAIDSDSVYSKDSKSIIMMDSDTISGNHSIDEIEEQVQWQAMSGILAINDPNQKYISKIIVRLELAPESQVEILIRYDQAKEFESVCVQRSSRLNSISVPIRPRRCDHMQLLFRGFGDCKIYSITKILRRGSDITR